ncbi:MAG: secretion protein HlyD [Chthoniobacteraceae bacterium]
MKRRLPIIIILLLVLGGGWYFYARESNGDQQLQLFGNIDIREVNLGFRVPGRISEVLKDEGDSVAPDEVIARLDSEPYRYALAQADAQVASLQSRLDKLERGYRKEEIEQARAALHEAEASSAKAEQDFARQQDLVRTKAISQQEFDAASATRDVATARQNSARANLDLLEAGNRPEEIAEARAAVAQAKATLEAARLQVSDTELKAAEKGVILTRAQEVGAIVQTGATLFTVSLQNPVWGRVYISEPSLGRIHPGMEVRVFTDSRPDHPFRGQVGYISPRAEFTPKSVETPDLRTSLVYRLRVVIADADDSLRQGMPITVRIPEA